MNARSIRTAWRTGGGVQFHTGAGIVADSVPELEYEETRHKAAGLLLAAQKKPPAFSDRGLSLSTLE